KLQIVMNIRQLAANSFSGNKPVAMLTDLWKNYIFYWIGRAQDATLQNPSNVIYATKFQDIHQAATFAWALLIPKLVNGFPETIRNDFPVVEKRVLIKYKDLKAYGVPF
ncbi:7889_t:CDS:1, partial [Paraglomus brasilianum]